MVGLLEEVGGGGGGGGDKADYDSDIFDFDCGER